MSLATFHTNFGRTGQHAWVYRPRLNTGSSQALIYCHHLGTTADVARSSFTVVDRFLSQLADIGYTVIVPSSGTDATVSGTTSGQKGWGNTNAAAATEDARLAAIATFGCTVASVPLVGLSMGGVTMLGYCRDNPTKVSCLVGIIPAVSNVSMYATWTNSATYQIPEAWGVTYPAALPSAATFTDKTALQGKPARFYCHSDDGLAVNSLTDSQALATWMGGDASAVNMGTGDHVPTIIDEVGFNRIASFLTKYSTPRP